ncbi:hypothetical protein LTR94_027604 [Friedmanniomyces endolithicus]|nr:hypothetical protein LTR94_027604 [Friedmanniomyces endolithicus]
MIPITDPLDPRIDPFRNIRERDLTGRKGLFIAEGEVVLRVLLSPASLCRPKALLLAERRLPAFSDLIPTLDADVPVFVAPQPVLDAIAGFDLHRGILAVGEKPAQVELDGLIAKLGPHGVLVVASGIGNHDNMGGLFRNAAAFGASGLVLDETCCDPFYRKAIRVSVGAVLRTPFCRVGSLNAAIKTLKGRGVEVLALTPAAKERLTDFRPRGATAIVLGSEGPGLEASIIDLCRPIGIPMAGGFDSLNVAVTSALALHQVTSAHR